MKENIVATNIWTALAADCKHYRLLLLHCCNIILYVIVTGVRNDLVIAKGYFSNIPEILKTVAKYNVQLVCNF